MSISSDFLLETVVWVTIDVCDSDEVAIDKAKFGKMERKLPALSIQLLNAVIILYVCAVLLIYYYTVSERACEL